jgi:hypothetical protein
VAYRPVAKRWLCKEWRLTGNARNKHVCNNIRAVFSVGPCRGVISGTKFRAYSSNACGGGVKYLHRSPASRRRRRKENPVPGGITGPPFSWGIWIRGPGPPGWVSLESETVKCGHEFRGTWTYEWLRWREPAAIANERPILSSDRILHKDYNASIQLENKITGRDSQGACRQDELIGGTATRKVTLSLTLTLTLSLVQLWDGGQPAMAWTRKLKNLHR